MHSNSGAWHCDSRIHDCRQLDVLRPNDEIGGEKMSKQLTEEDIRTACYAIDAFMDSLSSADKRKQQEALSKYIDFLFDAQRQKMIEEVIGDAAWITKKYGKI